MKETSVSVSQLQTTTPFFCIPLLAAAAQPIKRSNICEKLERPSLAMHSLELHFMHKLIDYLNIKATINQTILTKK